MAIPSLAMIPTGFKDGKLYSVLPESGAGDFSVVRGSGATRVDSNGLIESVGNNVPRLDYTDGGCPVLLTEPQSTNLLTYSEDFSDASWLKSNTSIVSNASASPDGAINADNLKDTSSNSIHRMRDGVSLLANTDYTISVFAKKGTLSNFQLALLNTADSKIASRVFDLENGTLGEELTATGGTLQNSEIKDYGNGWYRCSITAQLTTTPDQSQLTLAPLSSGNAQTANQVTYLGDGTGTISVWGAQLEALPYSTSYIPTSGAIATRLADSLTGAGDATTFNSTEGVLYAEIAALTDDGTTRYISLSDGTNSNDLRVYFNVGGNISVLSKVGGSTQCFINSNTYPQTDFNKVAFKYKENDFALWINGVEEGADVVGLTNVANTLNELAFFGNNLPFYGKTKDLRVYNTALTDLELQELTTI